MEEKTVKDAKNAYFRRWRAENKEKVREYNRKYWEKYAQKRLQAQDAEEKTIVSTLKNTKN